MSDRYKQYQHAVGGSTWHFEWCTKYRYKLFRKEYLKNLCWIALEEAARRYNIQIEAMNIQPDHIHVVLHMSLKQTPLEVVKKLKGFSSWMLFKLKPKLRLLFPKGSLWSTGKFIASVGDVDLSYVIEYVKNQDAHHAQSESSPWSEAEGSPERRGFNPRRRSIGEIITHQSPRCIFSQALRARPPQLKLLRSHDAACVLGCGRRGFCEGRLPNRSQNPTRHENITSLCAIERKTQKVYKIQCANTNYES